MIRNILRAAVLVSLGIGSLATGGLAQAAAPADTLDALNCVDVAWTRTSFTPSFPGSTVGTKRTTVGLRNSCTEDRSVTFEWIKSSGSTTETGCVPAGTTITKQGYDYGGSNVQYPTYREVSEGLASC